MSRPGPSTGATCAREGQAGYLNEVDRGNHFAAWQEPERFTSEARAAFRSLR
ncbi:MAG: hypothetical protein ACRDNG_13850 [Gaiellaceae bacterium]